MHFYLQLVDTDPSKRDLAEIDEACKERELFEVVILDKNILIEVEPSVFKYMERRYISEDGVVSKVQAIRNISIAEEDSTILIIQKESFTKYLTYYRKSITNELNLLTPQVVALKEEQSSLKYLSEKLKEVLK